MNFTKCHSFSAIFSHFLELNKITFYDDINNTSWLNESNILTYDQRLWNYFCNSFCNLVSLKLTLMSFIFLSSVLDFTIDCFQDIFSTNCLLWSFLLNDDENDDDENDDDALDNDDSELLDNRDLLFDSWSRFNLVSLNLKFVAILFLLCNQFCNQFKSNKKRNMYINSCKLKNSFEFKIKFKISSVAELKVLSSVLLLTLSSLFLYVTSVSRLIRLKL